MLSIACDYNTYTSDCYRYHRPLFDTKSKRIFRTIYEGPSHISGRRRMNPYRDSVNNLSDEIYSESQFVNYNDYYRPYSEPHSWGNPSNNDNNFIPQLPPQGGNKIFPCPELEIILKRLMVNFNLAIDHKWNSFTEIDATLFQQDLLSLTNVIRSEFYREAEKLKKSGYRVPTTTVVQSAIRKSLENLVSHSQGQRWYQRLRKNVGAATFRHIVNSIAEENEK